MKHLSSWALLCLYLISLNYCTPKSESKSAEQKEPEPQAKPVLNCQALARPLTFEGNNYYYLVTGFDSKQPDCYKYLRNYISEISPNLTPPFIMHFLDNLPEFKPAGGKLYGNESVEKKVIAQYMYFKGSTQDVTFDPLGYGTYTEPN
jgi:hypothetical protein